MTKESSRDFRFGASVLIFGTGCWIVMLTKTTSEWQSIGFFVALIGFVGVVGAMIEKKGEP